MFVCIRFNRNMYLHNIHIHIYTHIDTVTGEKPPDKSLPVKS